VQSLITSYRDPLLPDAEEAQIPTARGVQDEGSYLCAEVLSPFSPFRRYQFFFLELGARLPTNPTSLNLSSQLPFLPLFRSVLWLPIRSFKRPGHAQPSEQKHFSAVDDFFLKPSTGQFYMELGSDTFSHALPISFWTGGALLIKKVPIQRLMNRQ